MNVSRDWEPQESRGRTRPRFKVLVQLSLHQKLPVIFGLYRNPPPDHWALVSGLPTYVAQNGLVSSATLKGEGLESLDSSVKGFQIERVGNTVGSGSLKA